MICESLSWFNPSWWLSTMQSLAHPFPLQWDGEENEEEKKNQPKTSWVEIMTVY